MIFQLNAFIKISKSVKLFVGGTSFNLSLQNKNPNFRKSSLSTKIFSASKLLKIEKHFLENYFSLMHLK